MPVKLSCLNWPWPVHTPELSCRCSAQSATASSPVLLGDPENCLDVLRVAAASGQVSLVSSLADGWHLQQVQGWHD